MKRSKISNIVVVLVFIIVLWIAISTSVQSFLCPKMTQTELLLHTVKSFIFNWNKCY